MERRYSIEEAPFGVFSERIFEFPSTVEIDQTLQVRGSKDNFKEFE
jgi:hypothetical protein